MADSKEMHASIDRIEAYHEKEREIRREDIKRQSQLDQSLSGPVGRTTGLGRLLA